MITDIELAKEKLSQKGCTFAAAKDGELISSDKRGVAPLLDMLDSGRDHSGWSCADKVCGRAPALLYVLLGVKEVYSHVMTGAAFSILEKSGIQASFDISADIIMNRAGTDICPMEKAAAGIDDPEEAASAVRAEFAKLNKTE